MWRTRRQSLCMKYLHRGINTKKNLVDVLTIITITAIIIEKEVEVCSLFRLLLKIALLIDLS